MKKQIQAVIFDMDGLLVDSEPFWKIAESTAFQQIGVDLTPQECLKTTGLPTKDVVQYWFDHKPWQGTTLQEMENLIYQKAFDLITQNAEEMAGATNVLKFLKEQNLKIGLASASALPLIEAVLSNLNIKHFFDFYHSATLEKRNKPFPDVYLAVAKQLNVEIENCLILEDSGNGVKGAKTSGGITVAIPAPHEFEDIKFDIADHKMKSLEDFIPLFAAHYRCSIAGV